MMKRTVRMSVARVCVAMVMAGVWGWGGAGCAPKAEAGKGGKAGEVVALSPSAVVPPGIEREFRGVWVASVENINWPSKPGLSVEQQKAELRKLLDNTVAANFNAVLLQVRPTADALYASELEPWSYYLTGQQGKGPSPMYDPLEFAVREAHVRGLELHAWLNPFRVKTKSGRVAMSEGSLAKKHPEWVRNYNGFLWLDPGEPAARDHSLRVVADLVRRYDLDGVHIDDYFYPYKEKLPDGRELEFPDRETFAKYGNGRSIGDFRRGNINDYVRRLYEETKAIKPHVKVGISPFGIWRPGHPEQIRGMDAYEMIYGDSLLWLKEGWADYFTPQLYWPIAQTPQSFPVLLNWWNGENTLKRHLWPGLFTTRADGARATWKPAEVEYQIKTARGIAGPSGTIHFSASFLKEAGNPVAGHLRETVFQTAAAVPETPWLRRAGTVEVAAVSSGDVRVVREGDGKLVVSVEGGVRAGVASYVVQYASEEAGTGAATRGTGAAGGPVVKWRQVLLGTGEGARAVLGAGKVTTVAVTPLDRTGKAGKTVVVGVGPGMVVSR